MSSTERCFRRDAEERGPLDVRISAGRRGPRKAEKGRELAGANYRPRDRDLGEALDLALAVFAGVIEED
jgi:hypothetical protein